MNILIAALVSFLTVSGMFATNSVSFGAPTDTFQKNLIPLADSTYTVGTTTKAWLNGYFDQICLAGDCQTSWSAGAGETNTASTLGTGLNIYDSKSGVNLRFNSIAAGSNITLSTTTNSNTIVIASTASGGSAAVATSSGETAGQLSYWTSTAATPATLGKVATSSVTISSPLTSSGTAGAVVGGSGWTLGLNTSGTWSGNAVTATALAANGSNCSAGNAPLGVDASGAVESCFDVWTEAENTSAAYTPQSRQLTIAGTSNQITSSAGAQTLASDRTWTLSLPNHVIFPSSFQASLSSTTNATSTNLTISGNLITPVTSALVVTDANKLASAYGGTSCTNQFVRSLSALGAATCATVSSSDVSLANLTATDSTLTFSGTYNGSTARTIGINLSTANSWTGKQTFTAASSTSASISTYFRLPTATSFSALDTGALGYDTTSGNLIVGTTTAAGSAHVVFGGATTTLYSFSVASTSPDFASGGIIDLPPHFLAQKAIAIMCHVDGGTSQQIFLSDGTNDTNTITCSTTDTQYALTTNNNWNAYEAIRLEFVTKSGSPDYLTVRVLGYRTSD